MSTPKAISLLRIGVGLVHLAFPSTLVRRLAGEQLSDRGRNAVRVLGARQVAQALLSGRTPTGAVLFLGAEVDGAHAATMIVLAAFERRYRRAAGCDAAIATAFAVTGAAAAARSVLSEPVSTSRIGAWRDQWAERLARLAVPGYPPALTGSATARTEQHGRAH